MKYTALVTGSSRGIGKAIAQKLAENGFKVILHGSKLSENLKITQEELDKTGNLLMTTFFDISDNVAVTKSCEAILKTVGKVDVLINNAAISRDKTLLKMTDQDWDMVIKTNLYGPFYVTKQFLPQMKENDYGRVINLSSIAVRGAFGKSNYAASKAGLIGMTRSLALETGKFNITVNAVCPGYIETDLSQTIPLEYRKHFLSQIALGRIGSPAEVASVVSYLASSDSSYITGAVIDVNGGWL